MTGNAFLNVTLPRTTLLFFKSYTKKFTINPSWGMTNAIVEAHFYDQIYQATIIRRNLTDGAVFDFKPVKISMIA